MLKVPHIGKAQTRDSTLFFGGAASITNNGISLIPAFILGKPAAIFDLNLRRKRLSFEPQFRFSMNGKPWAFLFWWRYKMVNNSKFNMSVGAHPGFAFKEKVIQLDGKDQNIITSQRYFAQEIVPNYTLSKKVTLGAYYLHSNGFDPLSVHSTHFLAARVFFNKLNIGKEAYLTLIPQFYYLKINANDGIYASNSVVLGFKKCPISLSNMVSKKIQSNLDAKDFIWNLSLNYDFGANFRKK